MHNTPFDTRILNYYLIERGLREIERFKGDREVVCVSKKKSRGQGCILKKE